MPGPFHFCSFNLYKLVNIKMILLFLGTQFKKNYLNNYINIDLSKKLLSSQSKEYVKKFY